MVQGASLFYLCVALLLAPLSAHRAHLSEAEEQAAISKVTKSALVCDKAADFRNDDFDSVWELPEWRRCLSCDDDTRDPDKVKYGRSHGKCNKKKCAAIGESGDLPLCHRLKFFFNRGAWQNDAEGNTLQLKNLGTMQCVPCVPVAAPVAAQEIEEEDEDGDDAEDNDLDQGEAELPPVEPAGSTISTDIEELEPVVKEECAGDGIFYLDEFTRGGKNVIVCRNKQSGRFAKKNCCDNATVKDEEVPDDTEKEEVPAATSGDRTEEDAVKAAATCRALGESDKYDKHCKPRSQAFDNKRKMLKKKGFYVPDNYSCVRMYECVVAGKVLGGPVERVADCADMKGSAHKVCVEHKN